MSSLVKYEAARHALSLAVEVDEVKDIRDKAEAMAAYARQAKDTELVKWATEIKVRAERKAGQMLAEMEKNRGAMGTGSNQHEVRYHDVTAPKKLSDMGISKNESSRWQKLAAVTETQFEQAVSAAKEVAGEVTTAAMIRATQEEPHKPSKKSQVADFKAKQQEVRERAEVEELRESNQFLQEEIYNLRETLAIADLPEDERIDTKELLDRQRKEIADLKAELATVKAQRDEYMALNADMQRHIKRLNRA